MSRSLRLGEFTLSSGERSTYYVDARCTTLCAEGLVLVGRVGLAALVARGWDASHVGGLTMGADPLAYSIAHESWSTPHPLDAFTVRKATKEHGTRQRVEGISPGARCVVVEDAMTTGSSALEAVVAVRREHAAEVLGVLALVDREQGGRDRLRSEAGLELLTIFSAEELLAASQSLPRA